MDPVIEPSRDGSAKAADSDVAGMTQEKLAHELIVLRNAIRQHRDERGHDRCWVDDARLYRILPERELGDATLPPLSEFLENCTRFHQLRQPPEPKG